MLANILHILTLIGFAVHTVFGCCAHHAHDSTAGCCAAITESAADVHSGHAHCCDDHSHPIASCDCERDMTNLDSAERCVGHIQAMDDDADKHSEHSHRKCCELKCVYICAVQVTTAELADQDALVVALLPTDALCEFYPQYRRHHQQRSHSDALYTLNCRCALLQSWQI